MPFYNYSCPSCGRTHERFVTSYKKRTSVVPCVECGDSAYYEIAAPHIHWKFTDKEVRVPSNPTSVSVPRNLSVSVDDYKIVDTPKGEKKKFRNKGRKIKRKRKD